VDRSSRGWSGEVGPVTSTLARLGFDPNAAGALCGPEVMMRLVASDLAAAPEPAVYTGSGLANLRSGPATRYKLVGKAGYGEVLRALDQRDRWVKVRTDAGVQGWVARRRARSMRVRRAWASSRTT